MQVKSLSLESSKKLVALRHGLLIYFKGYMLRYYIVLFPLAAHSVAIRHRILFLSVKPESVIRFLFIFAYMCARLGHDSSKT